MADYSTTTELDELLRSSRRVRQRFEAQWYLNLSFYVGQQWVAWDGGRIFEPALDDSRVKVVDNRIQPIVRTELAKMTKSRPVWVGVPKDSSDKEIAAARMRERVFDHYWSVLNAVRKLRSALLWSRVCTAGFWKVWWDSSKGDSTQVLVGPDGKALKNQAGAPIPADLLDQLPTELSQGVKPRQVAMGEVCLDVRSPFEIYPDPLATDDGLESAEWVIEEAVYSPRYVEEHFGKKLEPDADATAGIAESRMPTGVAVGVLSGAGGDRKRGVKVREYWCKPNSEHPRGKRCVWAKDEVLFEDDNPYRFLPYVMFRGVPTPGRFWPDCVTSQLISPQTELNKRKAQIAENAERVGNAPLVAPTANEDIDQWQGLPGEVLKFQDFGTPGSIPQFLNVPELPGYVREDIDRIEQAIREISGQHEVSSGQVPTGVTAASAINLLQEQDDTRLGPDIEDMEQAITDAGRRLLQLVHDYADDERFIRIAGEDGAWDLAAFRGKQLGDATQDGVQAGSGIPQSKAAKQAAIQEVLNMFAQMQVQLPERDLRRVLQEYQVGGLEKFFASVGQDERQIQRENQRLAIGEQFQTNAYDDDELHVEGHTEFQKSAGYEELDDPVKQVFEVHVDEHRQKLQQAQQEMLQQQMLQQLPPGTQPSLPGLGGSAPPQNGGGRPQAALPSPPVSSST